MDPIKKIVYDCRHATFLIEKRQHTVLTVRERIQLYIHLAGCSVCRLFQQQSRVINRLVQGLFRSAESQENKLDDQYKRQLQDKINDRLK